MYPAFRSNFLTSVFALAHVISLPISFGLVTIINRSASTRVFLKWLAVVATPFLYSDEYDDYIFAEYVATILGVENFRENPPVVFSQYYDWDVWSRKLISESFGSRDEVLDYLKLILEDLARLDIVAAIRKLVNIAKIWLELAQQALDWFLARIILANMQLVRRISALLSSIKAPSATFVGFVSAAIDFAYESISSLRDFVVGVMEQIATEFAKAKWLADHYTTRFKQQLLKATKTPLEQE